MTMLLYIVSPEQPHKCPLTVHVECRVDYIETTPHVSRLHHLRIVTFMGILLVSQCKHALPNATTPFLIMELAIDNATPVQPESGMYVTPVA